jgi:hypothetical protein
MTGPADYYTPPSPSAAGSSSLTTTTDDTSIVDSDDVLFQHPQPAIVDEQLQKLDLIPAHDAWEFDIHEFLDSHTFIPPEKPGQRSGNNFKNYDAKKSIFCLCVLGGLDLHLHLLWYAQSILH